MRQSYLEGFKAVRDYGGGCAGCALIGTEACTRVACTANEYVGGYDVIYVADIGSDDKAGTVLRLGMYVAEQWLSDAGNKKKLAASVAANKDIDVYACVDHVLRAVIDFLAAADERKAK